MTFPLDKLLRREDLTETEAYSAFEQIMSGEATEAEIAALLVALAAKGETVDEVVGAARAMRDKVTAVRCDADCIDTCGTGGDGISTFNVSTTAAIIAAAAGATVAKHGNRTHSRASGSAEVLQCLGVNIEADIPVLERCLRECRIAFLYAPKLHPAMKYAVPVRKALKMRTIFNLLGPLTNPAGAKRQVIGVPRPEFTELLANALQRLGAARAMVVHGANGLCDMTITGPTRVSEMTDGEVHTYEVTPEDAGLQRAELRHLMVNSPQASAGAVREVLEGYAGPRRDHALLNAGAALVVAGIAEDLRTGTRLAAQAIDAGAARNTLARLVDASSSA